MAAGLKASGGNRDGHFSPCGDASPVASEGLLQDVRGLSRSAGSGHHHEIPTDERHLAPPEAFSANALEPVPRDSVTGRLDRDRQAQPCMGKPVGQAEDDELGTAVSLSLGAHGRVLARPRQPVCAGKGRAGIGTGAQSDRQAMTTLGAAGLDHKPAILRRHAGSEAMSPFAAQFAGLVGSFHGNRPSFDKVKRPGLDTRDGDATWPAALMSTTDAVARP